MEAGGPVASVAALAQIALNSYGSASRIFKDIQNAPREFSRLLQQLEILHCELSFLADIENQTARSDELPLLSTEAALLERALSAANELVSDVRNQLDKCRPRTPGTKARLQWAFKDKSRVDDLLSGLRHTEASLNTVLLLVNISYAWKAAQELGNLPPPQTQAPLPDTTLELSLPQNTLTSLFDRNPQAWNVFYGSWCSSKNRLLTWLGLQAHVIRYGNSLHSTYFLSASFGLWPWLVGARAVHFDLELRVFPLINLGFSILRGGLSVKRIVPESSELMAACRRGDVQTVRALFASQRASPFDTTPSNCGPLRFAIESGSLELVHFLCHHGADVNATFGNYETSPLDWAFQNRQIEIARFFISQGARLDYLCLRGWTPVMFLFQKSRASAPLDFFQLLSVSSFSDFDVRDRFGATALHRAARWGTAADVHTLLQLGASACLTDDDVGWTPAFQAAGANNVATLARLAESMSASGLVHHADFSGRTILHVAIQAGGLDTMRLVLELGADPHRPVNVEAQGGQGVQSLTPIEFAKSIGRDTYRNFVEALQLAGCATEDSDTGSVFWDAEE